MKDLKISSVGQTLSKKENHRKDRPPKISWTWGKVLFTIKSAIITGHSLVLVTVWNILPLSKSMILFKDTLCNVTIQVVLFEKDSGHLGKKELETILRGYIAIFEIFARKRLELRLSQISL